MKFLIVGLGSIGERHLKNLISIGEKDIIGVEINNDRINYIKRKYKIEVTKKLEDALKKKPDACLICTPPVLHVPVALKAAKAGCHIFIEKPLAHEFTPELNELEKIIKDKNLTCMIGYNQRFNKGILKLKELSQRDDFGDIIYIRAEVGQDLPSWRPWQDYTKSYTARRELGGGIILDASHEIDYVLWLMKYAPVYEIKSYYNKLSDLDINVEDIADILIIFKNGYASIHMNMIEKGYNRCCKIISRCGNWAIYDFKSRKIACYINGEMLHEVYTDYDMNETYIDEIKHFIECIKNKEMPLTNLDTAKKTLEVCMIAKRGGGKHGNSSYSG